MAPSSQELEPPGNPERFNPGLSLPGHARAHRPGLLLRGRLVPGSLPQAEGGTQDGTRPYTPRTNGMAERFNGRVQREVLGITIHSHADLETLLHGFNRAYNARRQRVLGGVSPMRRSDDGSRASAAIKSRRQPRSAPRSVRRQGPHDRRSRQGRLASRQLGRRNRGALPAAGGQQLECSPHVAKMFSPTKRLLAPRQSALRPIQSRQDRT